MTDFNNICIFITIKATLSFLVFKLICIYQATTKTIAEIVELTIAEHSPKTNLANDKMLDCED